YFSPEKFVKTPDGGYLGMMKFRLDNAKFNSNAFRISIDVVKYDKDMKFVKKQKAFSNDNGFAIYYSAIKESGGKFWLIAIEALKDNKEAYISNIVAFEIDPVTLEIKEKKIIAEQTNIDQEVNGYYENIKLLLETSQDKKHHALFIYNDKKEFYISALNENFEPVWKSKQYVPDLKMTMSQFRHLHVDNTGYIYLMIISEKEGAILGRYAANETAYRKPMAGTEEINEADFYTDASGKVLLIGTCRNNPDNVTGVFKSVLNTKTLDLELVQVTNIPAPLMERLEDEDAASLKPKKYGMYPYSFRSKLVGQEEGNIYLILETRAAHKSGAAIRFAKDIMTINFRESAIVFGYIRRTNMLTYENTAGHYYPYFCNDKLALVFYDNAANINKTINDKLSDLNYDKNAMLVAAFINPDGSVQKKEVSVNSGLGLWQSVNNFLGTECK
ncbi:MAG: hypothetical protein V4685_17200, partial [Bacteroidota bacterium]